MQWHLANSNPYNSNTWVRLHYQQTHVFQTYYLPTSQTEKRSNVNTRKQFKVKWAKIVEEILVNSNENPRFVSGKGYDLWYTVLYLVDAASAL